MPVKVRPRKPDTKPPIPEPPKPAPPVNPPIINPPVVVPSLGKPTGTIPTNLEIAYGRGKPWANVTRHAAHHLKYGTKYGVPPAMLMAMEVIESGGDSIPNGNGFPNWGIMQLTHSWNGGPRTKWERVGELLGVDFKSPEGQIAIAAYVLGGHDGDRGSPEDIFLSHYYPINGGLDVPGPDGHTQRQYLNDMHRLMAIIDAAAGTSPPTPAPQPKVYTEKDILNLLSNNAPGVKTSFGFNQLNTTTAQPIYVYGVGHGMRPGGRYHSGRDIYMPDETPVNALLDGEVICVGAQGREMWGQGCGYFSDDNGGIGKISVLTNRPVVTVKGKARPVILTYGHMSSATVKPGDRVTTGQRIGRSGHGGDFPHVHLDACVPEDQPGELNDPSIWVYPGAYHLIDPVPAVIEALGGAALPVPSPDPNITKYVGHKLPETDHVLYLPSWVGFRVLLTPPGHNRKQVPMRPTVSVYHSTNNTRPGTGAYHHAKWQRDGTQGHPNWEDGIGVHGYVDARECVWTMPIDEKGVHSGDWKNDWGIAIEKTTNSDQNQSEAENNAMHVHAGLMYILGKRAVDAMYPHTDGGGCPRIILPWKEQERIVDMRVDRIAAWVKAHP